MPTHIYVEKIVPYGYVPKTGFTIEMWFRRTALPTAYQALVQQQSQTTRSYSGLASANGRQFWLGFVGANGPPGNQGKLEFQVFKENSATSSFIINGPDAALANDSTWHHIALRMATDGVTFTIFIDGAVYLTQTAGSAMDWAAATMTFGASYSVVQSTTGDECFDGSFGYLSVFTTPLTDNRIAEHYTAGSGGTVHYGDDEVTRLNRIFDWSRVPETARMLDDAVTTMQGVKVQDQNALSQAAETATHAGGYLFADGHSRMVYHNRRRRGNRWLLATLSEETASAPEIGMEFTTDDTKVYNDVRGDRPYGGDTRIRNEESMAEYGQHTFEIKPAVTSDEDVRNYVGWIAGRYGVDRVRISGVRLRAESSDVIEDLVGRIKLGDWIAFDKLPENAPESHVEYVVEKIGVEADFKTREWIVELELSPAEIWTVFEVGRSTVGDGSFIAF